MIICTFVLKSVFMLLVFAYGKPGTTFFLSRGGFVARGQPEFCQGKGNCIFIIITLTVRKNLSPKRFYSLQCVNNALAHGARTAIPET